MGVWGAGEGELVVVGRDGELAGKKNTHGVVCLGEGRRFGGGGGGGWVKFGMDQRGRVTESDQKGIERRAKRES